MDIDQPVEWARVAADPKFQQLLTAKRRFIVPATVFFVIYYFSLPLLVGYAPTLMSKPVVGPVNLAYLFALSQFFVAWLVAFLYVRSASKFDRMAADVLRRVDHPKPENSSGLGLHEK